MCHNKASSGPELKYLLGTYTKGQHLKLKIYFFTSSILHANSDQVTLFKPATKLFHGNTNPSSLSLNHLPYLIDKLMTPFLSDLISPPSLNLPSTTFVG